MSEPAPPPGKFYYEMEYDPEWTTADVVLEVFAKQLAERINGGSFYDPTWYTEEQRELWRGHAAYFVGLMR
jgi:hypothetical protein